MLDQGFYLEVGYFMKHIIFPLMILLLLISCNRESIKIDHNQMKTGEMPVDNFAAFKGSVYPHSTKFEITKLHGLYYRRSNKTCKKCHGSDLLGGDSKIKVSCKKCHANFPHDDNFLPHKNSPHDGNLKKSEHGKLFLSDVNTCLKCHISDGQGGFKDVNCLSCHNYPHKYGSWSKSENHGVSYIKEQQLIKDSFEKSPMVGCNNCHNSKKFKSSHPNRYKSCDGCHTNVPHTFKNELNNVLWNNDDAHVSLIDSYKSDCSKCHNQVKEGHKYRKGYSDIGCLDCHDDVQMHQKIKMEWDEVTKRDPSSLKRLRRDKIKKKRKTTL